MTIDPGSLTEGDLLPDGDRYCEACGGPCRIVIEEEPAE